MEIDWNKVAGISFITLGFISAFFSQENLLISCGLAGVYCAIREINIKVTPMKEVQV